MKKILILFAAIVAGLGWLAAQPIVTTSPDPLQEGSEYVSITYFANQGNKGLMDLPAGQDVYAHVGVITNLSGGSWAYAPGSWGDNAAKYKLSKISANMYQLYIGDIRTYFGITNPNEHVEKIALVFRNGDCSREGKTATGGDIFVDVLPDGFALSFSSDAPLVLTSQTATVTFSAITTVPAKIEMYAGGTLFASADNAASLTKSYTFKQGDAMDVVCKATAAGTTEEQSVSICYPGDSQAKPFPGGSPTTSMGAKAAANGDVTFCLAAPGKTNCMLIPSWDGYKAKAQNVMNYTDVDGIRYFWTTVSGLDPDKEYPYYYLVDGSASVGDPYARLVLDPYSDKWLSDGVYPGLIPYPKDEVQGNVMLAVYKGNRDKYNWRVKDFRGAPKQDLIVYELLLRDFTGTDGKAYGDGTLAKAMGKLDYLQKLGVNAIELMPIQEFNGNNSWGYNTNFYFAPDKAYGTPDQYRAFIDECHSRGIAVILDVVFNQSDGLHPWYQMYPAGSNPFYNERAPHAYSVLNDWNQDNMLVQQQWTDVITYWMTAYKVDGFRFDLVKGLGDNESYGGSASDYNTNKYNSSRVARMKRLTDVITSINPAGYSINENLAGAQEENEMAANGSLNWANINDASCQFAMGYASDSNCNRFYAPNDSRTWGSTVSYAESHDEQRMAYKQDQWGVEGVKGKLGPSMQRLGGVAAQMLLAPGAHMIWQFGELGDGTNTKNSDGGNNTDPKPVVWNYLNVPERAGLYQNYCELIDLRISNPDLFAQSATFSMNCSAAQWAGGRTIYASAGSKEMICVINPNTTAKTVTGVNFKQKDNSKYTVRSASYGSTPAFDASAGTVTLEGNCYVVLTAGSIAGADAPEAAQAYAYGADGQIVIVGDYTEAAAYTLSGQRLPSLAVAPGLYIVTIDGRASKVLVK
ncbi:MAG: hypothetical protein K2N16_08830 [Muribaculaceae bacterium]|nr:hypothetical protein [Muribaculaceae bacterium]